MALVGRGYTQFMSSVKAATSFPILQARDLFWSKIGWCNWPDYPNGTRSFPQVEKEKKKGVDDEEHSYSTQEFGKKVGGGEFLLIPLRLSLRTWACQGRWLFSYGTCWSPSSRTLEVTQRKVPDSSVGHLETNFQPRSCKALVKHAVDRVQCYVGLQLSDPFTRCCHPSPQSACLVEMESRPDPKAVGCCRP